MARSNKQRRKLPQEPQRIVIHALSHEGRGIGRLAGKIAFVDGALPGEIVDAQFTRRRSQYDELRLLQLVQASEDRVVPPCPHFEVCGGCVMQHLAPEAQRRHKQSVLLEHLQHQAGLSVDDFELLPPLYEPVDTGYRRKARLAVRYVQKKGGALVGFRERHSGFITDMDSCAVLTPVVSALLPALRALCSDLEARFDIPQFELAVGESAPLSGPDRVVLIVRHMAPLTGTDLDKMRDFAEQHSIQWYLQSGGPQTVKQFWPETDQDRLYYHLPAYDLRMAFHPTDFTQVNGEINKRMIDLALQFLDLSPDDRVLDLFCGLGNFTLPIARHAGQVTGVEGSQEMVERGAENARANGIDNVSFHAADLSAELSGLHWAQQEYDRILLDPPRSGALELVSRIAEFNAAKVVYISCNPATLARDAAELVRQGYTLRSAGIMDMFPHTAHVESIAVFGRS